MWHYHVALQALIYASHNSAATLQHNYNSSFKILTIMNVLGHVRYLSPQLSMLIVYLSDKLATLADVMLVIEDVFLIMVPVDHHGS